MIWIFKGTGKGLQRILCLVLCHLGITVSTFPFSGLFQLCIELVCPTGTGFICFLLLHVQKTKKNYTSSRNLDLSPLLKVMCIFTINFIFYLAIEITGNVFPLFAFSYLHEGHSRYTESKIGLQWLCAKVQIRQNWDIQFQAISACVTESPFYLKLKKSK